MAKPKIKTTGHRSALSVASLCLLSSLAINSEAFAQLNVTTTQAQGSDVNAYQAVNVDVNDGLLQAETTSSANYLNAGHEIVNARLAAHQVMDGNTIAVTKVTGTNADKYDSPLGTPVYVNSQAGGNYTGMTTNAAQSDNTITQSYHGQQVYSETSVNSSNNSIYQSGEGYATATANQTGFASTDGRVTGQVSQDSNAYTQARVSADVVYSPSPNTYASNATNNYVSSNGTGASSLDLTTSQSSVDKTQAATTVTGGNMWNVTGTANAVANSVDLGNADGSMISANTQSNTAQVLSTSDMNVGEYGTAVASASGTGNNYYAGNNDAYVKLDNTQFNGGAGVDVSASFTGQAGYDSHVTADAAGNAATGFACAGCQADMTVNNSQTNTAGVSATATTTTTGYNRSVVSAAHATGNTTTYYVSGK